MFQPNDDRAVLDRYHQQFEAEQYKSCASLIASNLYAERDDPRVVAGMNLLVDTCLELCGSMPKQGAWQRLAVFCGQNGVNRYSVDAITRYLRRFADEDTRIEDFECTAKAMLLAYGAQLDAGQAAAHANGIHSWQGRSAYELLAAADYLTQTAIQLLQQGDEHYLHEKLEAGIDQITNALYEGVRGSQAPELYDFHSSYFPKVSDRR